MTSPGYLSGRRPMMLLATWVATFIFYTLSWSGMWLAQTRSTDVGRGVLAWEFGAVLSAGLCAVFLSPLARAWELNGRGHVRRHAAGVCLGVGIVLCALPPASYASLSRLPNAAQIGRGPLDNGRSFTEIFPPVMSLATAATALFAFGLMLILVSLMGSFVGFIVGVLAMVLLWHLQSLPDLLLYVPLHFDPHIRPAAVAASITVAIVGIATWSARTTHQAP